MTLKIKINRKNVESMTRQLTDQLGSLISSGALAIGSYASEALCHCWESRATCAGSLNTGESGRRPARRKKGTKSSLEDLTKENHNHRKESG